LALFALLDAMAPLDPSRFLIIAAIYEAAGVIGMAALFAPSGLGVREGVLLLLLPLVVPQSAVIIGVILIRLINTGCELFLAAISLATRPRLKVSR